VPVQHAMSRLLSRTLACVQHYPKKFAIQEYLISACPGARMHSLLPVSCSVCIAFPRALVAWFHAHVRCNAPAVAL
jgi:hypothetical protein